MHGGKSLGGIASPTTKTGRYSKFLPAHLKDRYEDAIHDRNLLVMRDDIGLVDARVGDLVSKLDQADNAARWGEVRTAFEAYTEALDAAESTESEEAEETVEFALQRLRSAIYAGRNDDAVWDKITDGLNERRKLVESERKRLVDLQQMITAEQANVLMKQIADSIRTHVTDPGTLQAISADLLRLLNTQSRGMVEIR